MTATYSRDSGEQVNGHHSQERPVLVLAADHRESIERDLYGLTAPATPLQAARISADKLIVYQALLDATEQLPADVHPGILVDEQYGATIAELAARSAGIIDLSMPIESSDQRWFHFAYDEDWTRHADFFHPDHVKALARDNPGLDRVQRKLQAERLAKVSSWASANGRSLVIELNVPPSHSDNYSDKGDQDRYERELRPKHTLTVMKYLQDHGVEPDIWQIEGLNQHDDAVAIAAAAGAAGRPGRCMVLGRHASHETLDHWLQVAAPIPGWIGFVIGRSIWWDALHAHLHHHSTAGEAQRRICAAYLDFARYFVSARNGTLSSNPDPEFW